MHSGLSNVIVGFVIKENMQNANERKHYNWEWGEAPEKVRQ